MTGEVVALDGFHAVKHVLRFAPQALLTVVVADPAAAARLADALAPDIRDALLDRAVLGPVGHPTGVCGTAQRPEVPPDALRDRRGPLVVLDDVRHPGNAGAAIRVAAAAGAGGVLGLGALDLWHPSVVRGAAGLHWALPVASGGTAADLQAVGGPVVALDGEGEAWPGDGSVLDPRAVLVVGSERHGLTPDVRRVATSRVALPMRPGVSSVNLAAALAAVLYARLLT